MKTYSDKLKDPRWQKKRLEILQRDGWKCLGCGEDKKTLNVHHLMYIEDKEPWEYEDRYYMTLCDECHSMSHLNITTHTTRESFDIDKFVNFIEPVWIRKYVSDIEFHKGDTILTLREGYNLEGIHLHNILKILGRLKKFIREDNEQSLFLRIGDGANDIVPIHDFIQESESYRKDIR
jgi:hypothetical protein